VQSVLEGDDFESPIANAGQSINLNGNQKQGQPRNLSCNQLSQIRPSAGFRHQSESPVRGQSTSNLYSKADVNTTSGNTLQIFTNTQAPLSGTMTELPVPKMNLAPRQTSISTSNIQLMNDEEHNLIAKLCNTLNSSQSFKMSTKKSDLTPVTSSSPKSKRSVSTNIIEQKEELENIIQDLEEENAYLINEYTRLQNELNTTNQSIQSHNQKTSHFSLRSSKSSTLQGRTNPNRLQQHLADMSTKYSHSSQAIPTTTSTNPNVSTNSAQINSKYASLLASLDMGNAKESQILAEARSLRQHEDRLEARMKILENHNRLLETQLKQLRGLQSNVNRVLLLFLLFRMKLYFILLKRIIPST
jgi:hypothetical protein